MFGLDLLSAGSFLILAAGQACQPPAPAKINILPKTAPVGFDYSRSLAALQSQKTDTINPYGFHDVTYTQGFMEGLIRMKPSIKMGYQFQPRAGGYCFWYETIDISLEIEPMIVIAKEVSADPCMRKAVTDHEMKHVRVDREVVNKYARVMGRKVYDALKARGFAAGPVPEARMQATLKRMQDTVYRIAGHEYKKMELERTERQQAVDSLEEYEAVGAHCPGRKSIIRSTFER